MNSSSHAPPAVFLFRAHLISHLLTLRFELARSLKSISLVVAQISFPMDNHSLPPSTSTTGLAFPSLVAGGVKPEAALVMDWSVEEQYVLENGLAK